MPSVKPAVEAFARIKVVGCGGSGGNVLDHMIRSKVPGVDFIAVNTDAQDLHHNLAPKKIHIGKNLTRGLGAGMNPELGRQAAEETIEEIKDALKGSDMVFVACGMGGGTGTGAGPVVAEAARSQGALAVAVVTKPFSFEGAQRMRIAEEGLERLRESVDAVVVIPNDRLLSIVEKGTTFKDAFAASDEVLRQAVQGISDLITMPGIVNVDFADVKAVIQGAGSALMGIGRASGENRAVDAAKEAINSPLLDIAVDGAKGVLFAIHGGSDMSMWEVQEAARVITESVDKDAKIIFGAIEDQKLKKGEIKITVIASGFPEQHQRPNVTAFSPEKQNESVSVSLPPSPAPEKKRVFEPPLFSSKPPLPSSSPSSEKPAADTDDADLGWDDTIPAFLRRKK